MPVLRWRGQCSGVHQTQRPPRLKELLANTSGIGMLPDLLRQFFPLGDCFVQMAKSEPAFGGFKLYGVVERERPAGLHSTRPLS